MLGPSPRSLASDILKAISAWRNLTLRFVLAALIALAGLGPAYGLVQEGSIPACGEDVLRPDGLRVFVVTMSPGQEAFSVFGHNGIWVSDARTPREIVYNYGTFSDKDPELLPKFIKGELIYWLDTRSYGSMMRFYAKYGRTVAVQELLLPGYMKRALVKRLERGAQPENREYLYHWFAQNCTTKIRDLINDFTGGDLELQHSAQTDITQRYEVLRHMAPHIPEWYAWTFSVGPSADRPLNAYELMFLPDRLMDGLAHSTYPHPDKTRSPLVGPPCIIYHGKHGWPATAEPTRGPYTWTLGALLAALLLALGLGAAKHTAWRVILGTVIALFGLIATALGSVGFWAASTARYEGYSNNANLLLAHPASLLLTVSGILLALSWRRGHVAARWMTAGLAGLGGFGLAAGLLGPQAALAPMGLFAMPLGAIAMCAWYLAPSGSPRSG